MDLIDCYRGVAILSVLLFHFTVALTPPFEPNDAYGFAQRYPTWLEAGRYGVHLFFVISGLVISMTLVRSSGVADFAWKRFARIYPTYFVAATATLLLGALTGFYIGGDRLSDYFATLTMAAPHLGRTWVDPVFWSLLVEVKFYVLVALAFAVLKTRFWIGVAAYALGAAAVAHSHQWSAHVWLISDELPFFLLGMGAWFGCFEQGRRFAAAACIALGLALYAYYSWGLPGPCNPVARVCMQFDGSWVAHGYLGLTAGSMLVLLFAGVRGGWAPLAWVGRISYSLYLSHALLGVDAIRLAKRAGAPDLAATAAAMLVSVAAGAALFYLVEEPSHQYLKQAGRRLIERARRKPAAGIGRAADASASASAAPP
jgi:peptidoglycan/LPS O-acetylase OafA/YrhL